MIGWTKLKPVEEVVSFFKEYSCRHLKLFYEISTFLKHFKKIIKTNKSTPAKLFGVIL
jgi:hypothetical protein